MPNPFLNIACTVYNHEKFIVQTIEGFLMQKTNFDFLIVIGDDCSTETTRDIILQYSNKFPDKFHLIFQERNVGAAQNFNDILTFCQNSKSKYIAQCEGDDFWTDPYKLQKQVDFLEANEDFQLCFHDVNLMINNKIERLYVNKSEDEFYTKDLFDRHFIPTCSIVFRNNLTFPDWFHHVASGDRALLFLCSMQGRIKYLNQMMGVYRIHGGGVSNEHKGIKKIYDSAVLFNYFNTSTNFSFTDECYKGLEYEIKMQYSREINENNRKTIINNLSFKELLIIIFTRVRKAILIKLKLK